MTTYSDRLLSLRRFLVLHKAQAVETYTLPENETQERWILNGADIVIRIHQDGSWTAYIPAADRPTADAQVAALERYLRGHRPDLDIIHDMGNVSRHFLDRLQELPGCTDTACTEPACAEKRNLQAAVESLLKRIFSPNNDPKEPHGRAA